MKFEEILGTYSYTYHDDDHKWDLVRHEIVLKSDTTYTHKMYHRDSLLIDEQGFYKFDIYAKDGIYLYKYTAYDRYLEEIPTNKTMFFLIRKTFFGSLYLTFNWGIDPDGEPMKPRYKKIK